MATRIAIPLPKAWSRHAKSAFVRATALAHQAATQVRGWCADSHIARVRLAARVERLESENALLREELRIKDARMARVDPKRRPHYKPEERLAIVVLRAARGWSLAHTARVFHLAVETVAGWTRRVDEDGQDALLKMPEPVNRFDDYAAALSRGLKALFPSMGRRRISNLLARAAFHISPSTVRNHWRRRLPVPPPEELAALRSAESDKSNRSGRTATARYPGHVYNADLTVVPTCGGFWVPWLPQALLPIWPFCFWILLVVDHFSRRIMAGKVFDKQPTSDEVCAVFETAALEHGAPKYTVTDQGPQFGAEFRGWCARRGVRPRFGAIGKHGSIAVTERCLKALKSEGVRPLLVPLNRQAFERELHAFIRWFNAERPHEFLDGATPDEVYYGLPRARDGPVWEPRKRYPRGRRKLRGPRGARLVLDVRAFEGRRHLPLVRLKRAA